MIEAANMKTVQTVLFVFLMAGASWWDIRKRIFPDHYVLLLILAALISFDQWKLTGILAAIPFFLTALWIGGIGGGDVKFVAVSGLVLGFGRTFVGVYADEGITGTSTKKRDDFKRLIRDCMAGRIDLIITKLISRFARNTLD